MSKLGIVFVVGLCACGEMTVEAAPCERTGEPVRRVSDAAIADCKAAAAIAGGGSRACLYVEDVEEARAVLGVENADGLEADCAAPLDTPHVVTCPVGTARPLFFAPAVQLAGERVELCTPSPYAADPYCAGEIVILAGEAMLAGFVDPPGSPWAYESSGELTRVVLVNP